ncbi:MAG TPA: hypothetical protein VGO46_00040 [Gemmatimonadaceae bacterium]|jgi:hypothetical protein|nr:hypothetical protein [Gemmatimonadaceae bacterium]
MSELLLALVKESVLPALEPLGYSVVESIVSDSFDNATVTLEAPKLRIEIVRERSIVRVGFGAVSMPNSWFDSAVVIDYLELSAQAGFHDRNARVVLAGVGAFVRAFQAELEMRFSPAHLAATTAALTTLQNARAATRFGS